MVSYSTLPPVSQKYLMDMRNECTKSGTIWAICTVIGSCGMSTRQVCMNTIISPSGRVMYSGFDVGCKLIICALGKRKCLIVPESKIPWSVGVWASVFILG